MKKAIELIREYSPKNFGLKGVYYKANGKKLEMFFIVNEKNAQSLISYVNSLSSLVGKEIKELEIESKVFLYKKEVEGLYKKDELQELKLKLANFS